MPIYPDLESHFWSENPFNILKTQTRIWHFHANNYLARSTYTQVVILIFAQQKLQHAERQHKGYTWKQSQRIRWRQSHGGGAPQTISRGRSAARKTTMSDSGAKCSKNYKRRKNNLSEICIICTDKASTHMHYGVSKVCFSCRAFFRRIVRRKSVPKKDFCNRTTGQVGQCEVNTKTRHLCRYVKGLFSNFFS